MNDPLVHELLAQIRGAAPASPATRPPNVALEPAGTFVPTSSQPDARLVSLRNFLHKVLPEDGPIYFAVTLAAKHSGEGPRHYACRSIDELADRLLARDDAGHEVYFATATYQQARFTDSAGRSRQRCRENVAAVRACWLDIDVGEEKAAAGEGYATQAEARQALAAFGADLAIEPSLVVSSGRGLHVYYAFQRSVSPEEWKRAAKSLKHACTLAGLRADGSRTGDVASMLRPVLCMHRKDPANPQRVEPLSSSELIPFAQFLGAVERLSTALRNSRDDLNGSTAMAPVANEWPPPPAGTALALVNNSDLSTGPCEPSSWLRGLSADDQLRLLDDACSAIPDAEWSRYETWQAIIAGFRGLHELDEAKRLAILQRHSERSPKWAADGWNSGRLQDKFRSFDGGSARRIFELAEAYGARRTARTVLQPFDDLTAAEDYLVARFIFVMNQGGYLDTKSRQLIATASLDESQSWLTRQLGTTPRRLLKSSARTRRADSLGYKPGADAIYEEQGRTLANLYSPWEPATLQPTVEEQAIWDWFIEDHLFRRPEDKAARDYFLNALAYPLQHPGRRVASVPLLIGEQYGSGKSTLMERVPRLVYGDRNVTVATQSEIESGFNDWHANAQIVCFPEIWMGGRDAKKIANDLKDKITNDMLRVYPKGLKGYSQPNRATLLGTSNYENAVHLREGDRRWGVHITDASKMDPSQAEALYAFLNSSRAPGVLRHILSNRDLSAFNPAGEPPMTVGKRRVIAASRSLIEAEIVDMFENREAPFDRDVFVLESLRAALHDRVPNSDKIAPRKLAQYVQVKPISAVWLGRKRIKATRTLSTPGALPLLVADGKHGIWCVRNGDVWESAQDKDIARHLETGAPPLAAVQSAAADATTPRGSSQTSVNTSMNAKPPGEVESA